MKKRLIIALIFVIGCSFYAFETFQPEHTPDKITRIPEHPQRSDGDVEKGWDYLRYGNYIGAGVPYSIFKRTLKDDAPNYLQREGKSEKIPHVFNLFQENGVEVVGGLNCFGCHGGLINGEFIAGLGNSQSDFANPNNGKFFKRLQKFVRFRYGKRSGQYKAFLPLARGSEFVSPYVQTPFFGINPAFKLEEAAVSFRHPEDLTWADDEQIFEPTQHFYASDVPPLWNVKKKNALYYNAMGRGDFTKLLMQVMVVAIEDSTEARQINNKFHHVLAWLENLEPPKYKKEIDEKLVEEGKAIFEDLCSKCHGTYGEDEYYPNKLVGLNIVKTDSFYAQYSYRNDNFTNWLNDSWIMKSEPRAWVQPELGYMAPPLDGIWATAPYLHNGSIPDLETLLNSAKRPKFWKRVVGDNNYNLDKVGLNYIEVEAANNKLVYNTEMNGYGNYGHTFGDVLNDKGRKALIEYLKTL